MAIGRFRSGLVTFNAAAQSLATVLDLPEKQRKVYRFELQPDAANVAACYYGGSSVATTGIRMEAPDSGVPPPPAIWEVYATGVIDLADVFVLGANNEKLRVCWVPYL